MWCTIVHVVYNSACGALCALNGCWNCSSFNSIVLFLIVTMDKATFPFTSVIISFHLSIVRAVVLFSWLQYTVHNSSACEKHMLNNLTFSVTVWPYYSTWRDCRSRYYTYTSNAYNMHYTTYKCDHALTYYHDHHHTVQVATGIYTLNHNLSASVNLIRCVIC